MIKLNDLQEKIRYNNTQIAPSVEAAGFNMLATKIRDCSQYSMFATCKSCGAYYYVGSSAHCNSRFCSICAKRRALAWLVKLMPLLEEYRRRGYLIFFLNLTIKDQSELAVGLKALGDSWRYMTHDDKLCRREFRALNNGGVRSVEVKLGVGSGIWHPHIHAITIVKSDKEVRQFEAYRLLWERATDNALHTGAKVGSVFIKGIKSKDGERGNYDLMCAVVETFKYICKFEWLDLPTERVKELINVTSGKHFIASWGELYGLKAQVEELLGESTEDELKNKVCKVCGCSEFELETLLTKCEEAPVIYFAN